MSTYPYVHDSMQGRSPCLSNLSLSRIVRGPASELPDKSCPDFNESNWHRDPSERVEQMAQIAEPGCLLARTGPDTRPCPMRIRIVSSACMVANSAVSFEITFPSRQHLVDVNNSASTGAKLSYQHLTTQFPVCR